jgi:phage gp16-like protein
MTMNAAQMAAHEIKLIHIGRSHLAKTIGMDEDAYRDMLAGLCNGKTSSKDLTWQERKKVLDHMGTLGFKVRKSDGRQSIGRNEWQADKLRKMWHELALVGAVEQLPDLKAVDAAIEAWAARMLGKHWPGSLRLVKDRDMRTLIESMKKWCLRLKIDLDDGRMAEPGRKALGRETDGQAG